MWHNYLKTTLLSKAILHWMMNRLSCQWIMHKIPVINNFSIHVRSIGPPAYGLVSCNLCIAVVKEGNIISLSVLTTGPDSITLACNNPVYAIVIYTQNVQNFSSMLNFCGHSSCFYNFLNRLTYRITSSNKRSISSVVLGHFAKISEHVPLLRAKSKGRLQSFNDLCVITPAKQAKLLLACKPTGLHFYRP